jgi:hypothetical protein
MAEKKHAEVQKIFPGVREHHPDPRELGRCEGRQRRFLGAVPVSAALPERVPVPEVELLDGTRLRWQASTVDASRFSSFLNRGQGWELEGDFSRIDAARQVELALEQAAICPFRSGEELLDATFPLVLDLRKSHGISRVELGRERPSVHVLECRAYADDTIQLISSTDVDRKTWCERRLHLDLSLPTPLSPRSFVAFRHSQKVRLNSWVSSVVLSPEWAISQIGSHFPWMLICPGVPQPE